MRLLALALVIGCSGSGGGIDSKDYSADAQTALCAYEVRCGLFANTTDCDEYFTVNSDATFQAELAKGIVHYDGSKAEECFNDLRDAPCDQTSMEARSQPSACVDAITGTVATGGMCVHNEECQSEKCAKANTAGDCDSGTCEASEALGKLGDACATRNCDPAFVCDNTKVCANLYTVGMPCTYSTDCAYGLACDASPGFCRTAPKIGEACPDKICAELGAYCSTAGTCTALGLAGSACNAGQQCSEFYPCNTMTGMCTANPTLGQACTSECSDGSFCNTTTHLCAAPLPNGSVCESDSQCTSADCDTTSGLCADAQVCT
jgi:hypothetical protein